MSTGPAKVHQDRISQVYPFPFNSRSKYHVVHESEIHVPKYLAQHIYCPYDYPKVMSYSLDDDH